MRPLQSSVGFRTGIGSAARLPCQIAMVRASPRVATPIPQRLLGLRQARLYRGCKDWSYLPPPPMMAPSPGTPPVPVPPAGLGPDTSPPPGSEPPCPPRPVLPLVVSGVTGDEPAASVPFLLEALLRGECLTWGAEPPGALEPEDAAAGALDWAKADMDSKMPRGSTAQALTRIAMTSPFLVLRRISFGLASANRRPWHISHFAENE